MHPSPRGGIHRLIIGVIAGGGTVGGILIIRNGSKQRGGGRKIPFLLLGLSAQIHALAAQRLRVLIAGDILQVIRSGLIIHILDSLAGQLIHTIVIASTGVLIIACQLKLRCRGGDILPLLQLQTQQIVRALQHFGAALIIAQISQVIDCQGIIALLQHLSRQAVARVLRFLRAVCKVAQRVEGRNRPRVIASRQQLLRLCIAHLAQALVRILISGNVLQQRSSAVQIARLLQLHSRDVGILLPHGRRFVVGYGGDQQLTRGGIIARLGLFTRQLAAAVVDQLLRVAETRGTRPDSRRL